MRTAEDVLKTFANQNEVNVPPNPTYIINILFFETLPELSENNQEKVQKI